MDTATSQVTEQMEAPEGASIDEAGVAENAVGLWRDLRSMAYEHVHLAALEAQRAGRNLVVMLAASIVLALLVAGTLLILTGALILALIEFGLAPSVSALFAALLTLAASVGIALVIRARSRTLGFPATLRSLKPTPEPSPSNHASS